MIYESRIYVVETQLFIFSPTLPPITYAANIEIF